MSNEIKEHTKSLRDLADAALEYTFIEGSADFTANEEAEALQRLHVAASLHRRRIEKRAMSMANWNTQEEALKVMLHGWVSNIVLTNLDNSTLLYRDTYAVHAANLDITNQ